jgi:hypothetical protein
MEQRRQKRIVVGYKAEISYSGKKHECVIENLSASGANVLTVTIPRTETDFKLQDVIDLKFEPHPGDMINLKCRIQWSRETLPHRLSKRLGLELIDPSWDRSVLFV